MLSVDVLDATLRNHPVTDNTIVIALPEYDGKEPQNSEALAAKAAMKWLVRNSAAPLTYPGLAVGGITMEQLRDRGLLTSEEVPDGDTYTVYRMEVLRERI